MYSLIFSHIIETIALPLDDSTMSENLTCDYFRIRQFPRIAQNDIDEIVNIRYSLNVVIRHNLLLLQFFIWATGSLRYLTRLDFIQ